MKVSNMLTLLNFYNLFLITENLREIIVNSNKFENYVSEIRSIYV